jgi:hypothetical protein
MLRASTTVFPLFFPDLVHHLLWDNPVPSRNGVESSAVERVTSRNHDDLRRKALHSFLFGIDRRYGDKSRHWGIAVEDHYLLAVLRLADVSAEVGLQFADLDGSHDAILPPIAIDGGSSN